MCARFDATILLEQAPEIEEIDGLFFITDRIGNLVIRRCFRPSTFHMLVRLGQEQLAKWQFAQLDDKVVPLRH
jgi:hypothetical protein